MTLSVRSSLGQDNSLQLKIVTAFLQVTISPFPLDENYLLAVARYVERNPVRAGTVEKPWEYQWSSTSAHSAEKDDLLVKISPLLQVVGDWKEFLSNGDEEKEIKEIRRHERTGRPLGRDGFVIGLEKALGRTLRYQKSDPPKAKRKNNSVWCPPNYH